MFGVNVFDSILNGLNYARSLKGMQLLKEALMRLQLQAMLSKNSSPYQELESVKALQCTVVNKNRTDTKEQLMKFLTNNSIIQDFKTFVDKKK